MQLNTQTLPEIDFDLLALALDDGKPIPKRVPRVEVEPGSQANRILHNATRAFLAKFTTVGAVSAEAQRAGVFNARRRLAEALSGQAVWSWNHNRLADAAVLFDVARRVPALLQTPLVLNGPAIENALAHLTHYVQQISSTIPTDESTRFLKARQVEIDTDDDAVLIASDRMAYLYH